jgi:isopentenyl-diphosphate delta-isomerase
MRDEEEQVLLVDSRDRVIGTGSKLDVHRDAIRHRAFSVFLFDGEGATLIQARARAKYHSGGLWSNACCGHPRVGERTRAAAERRLFEELGVRTTLRKAGQIAYRAELPGGWHENEIVHLFTGTCTGEPAPDAAEVEGWRWADVAELATEASNQPARFTAWFGIYARAVPEIVFGRQGPRAAPLAA